MEYKLSDFDFNLPDELIATHPAEPRDSSRLLVLDKKTGVIEHKHFYDIIDYLCSGDILVLNNSKVIPARLMAIKKETGGKVEVLLHKKLSANIWQCLLGGKVKEGLILLFRPSAFCTSVVTPLSLQEGSFAKGKRSFDMARDDKRKAKRECLESAGAPLGMTAVILKNNHDGTWDLQFNKSGAALMKAIEKIGEVPLPPYIVNQRKHCHCEEELCDDEANPRRAEEARLLPSGQRLGLKAEISRNDKSDYQTVFADDKKVGSVAAPTAGLHFTPELLKKIKNKGVKILEITLYVGMGTFAPVKVEDFTKHKMHAEWVEIDQLTIRQIREKREGRVIAVGTTSARSLEALSQSANFKVRSAKGDFKAWVDIFIYPGYKFKIIDALITNFHLPKSTLLMLVSALAGKKNIDKAYREAIKKKYRFYSYGDAMFIK
jgi:S-adenosylmethionine:tRNA ribosyltransferase-isomerase